MSVIVDQITAILQAELDEHGTEDDNEKRWQVARHWAQRIVIELNLTEEITTGWADGDVIEERRWITPWAAMESQN